MTPEDFGTAMKEIITPQDKPRSTGNSYFRKMGEKRRRGRFIKSELLKNPARHFYNRLISQGSTWDIGDCSYMYLYFYGVSGIYRGVKGGIRYNSSTGRLKLCSNCVAHRKVKTRRLIKRLQRRNPRRFKGDIANGSEYKKLHLNSAY